MSREHPDKNYEEILSVYRKGDEERYADDFSEALNALESDRELEQWFADDQAFDAEFRDALSGFAAPEPKTEAPAAVESEKILRFPFLKLAAAAAVVIIGLFGVTRYNDVQDQKSAALVADLRESMAAFAASPDLGLDMMDNDLSKLRKLNVSNGGSYGEAMDQVFANGLPMGCKVIDWDGRNVSLYCFGNDQGQVVHCFVVPLDALNGSRAAAHLKEIIAHAERDTGGFVAGETAYLLVSSMPGVDIKPFLIPAQEAFLTFQSLETGGLALITFGPTTDQP